MGIDVEMVKQNMADIKLKYIRQEPYMWFKFGNIYNGQRNKHDPKVFGIFLTEEQFDQAGFYVFPADWFEIIKEL